MRKLADGVFHVAAAPFMSVNAYLIDDVLIDAGVRVSLMPILHQLRGQTVRTHALTHPHPDHQGATHALCEQLDLPLWCSAIDTPYMENGEIMAIIPPRLGNRIMDAAMSGPGHPVARRLKPGDRVGSFEVIATPGHTPGHISFWREDDGVLILGDVLRNQHPVTLQTELAEPFDRFTCDIETNRDSIRAIAALQPNLVCFGHGPPLRDPQALADFAEQLA